jgi:hypothetical protein
MQGVKDSPALRAAVEEVQPENVALGLRLSQSKPLYQAYKALRCVLGECFGGGLICGGGELGVTQVAQAATPKRNSTQSGMHIPQGKRGKGCYNQCGRGGKGISSSFCYNEDPEGSQPIQH